MPSHAEPRRRLELAARTIALAALAVLLWRSWNPRRAPADAERVNRVAELDVALVRATAAAPETFDLVVDRVPAPAQRDWLRAIRDAGTDVRWHTGATLQRIATSLEPVATPARRVRLTTLASTNATLQVTDAAGVVDSAVVGASGVRVLDATLDGTVTVLADAAGARVTLADSLVLRPVLVLARAGWEGKFVVTALEEDGWNVESRLAVAPAQEVVQGASAPIDTSQYAAVVALDASAAPYAAAIARYVRNGGGVILTPEAAMLPALATIAPARAGDTLPGLPGALATEVPRAGLDAVALRVAQAGSRTPPRSAASADASVAPPRSTTAGASTATGPAAVVLERRGTTPVVIAARTMLGRTLVSGYRETWRWRMEGPDGAPAAHRAWWSSLVGAVAYTPVVQRTPAATGAAPTAPDPAPFASLVAALGAPSDAAADAGPLPPRPWEVLLFAVLLGGLLVEWASRRLRGAR